MLMLDLFDNFTAKPITYTWVIGDREFKAHKLILSSRSVVFEKMFEHDLEESKRNRVVIEDMSAGALEDLLKFIYTGKVEGLDEHVHELYAAADKYQIDSLKSYCALYLSMSISVSTVAKTLQLAELYSLGDLKSKCIDYITRNSTLNSSSTTRKSSYHQSTRIDVSTVCGKQVNIQ